MSTTATPVLTSFNGGELSRRLHGRTDTAIYAIGVEEMENFAPTVEGSAVKRPGFRHIRPARAGARWLSRFLFSDAQAYALEWSDGRVRFYTGDGRIEDGAGAAVETVVPYSAAQAPALSTQQSFDRLYLAHPAHPPAALARTGATSFVHEVLALEGGPFADTNIDEGLTVRASGTEGVVTLTASAPIFRAGHVGSPFRIEAQDFAAIRAWEPGFSDVAVGDVLRSDGKAYTAVELGTAKRTGSVQPIHGEGSAWDGIGKGKDVNDKAAGGVRWAYRHDLFGIGTIAAVGGDGLTATLSVTRRLPDSVTTVATRRWAHGVFGAAAGWPGIVLVAFGRLMFIHGFDLIASVAGSYRDFRTLNPSGQATADMGFRRRLSLANPPLWAKADRKRILVGTVDGEYSIEPINPAEPLSGENIDAVPQSYHGSAAVPPVQIGTATIFVQRGGRKLRLSDYDFGRDRNSAENLTVWARHITRGGVAQLGFQQNPEELLLAVRGDGQVAVHPRSPEQEVKGFARIVPGGGGRVVSLTTIPDADGLDAVWALIERAGVRSVEKMDRWWDEDAGMTVARAFFVDGGVSHVGLPIERITSGLSHLTGRTVRILADGATVPDQVVNAAGGLDAPLPAPASVVHVGLPYAARLRTLRPELRDGSGQSAQGKRKRLVKLALRLLDAAGIRVGPVNGELDTVLDRPLSTPMDMAPPLFSGDTIGQAVSGSWERGGQAEIVSDDALPCIVTAAMPTFEVSTS